MNWWQEILVSALSNVALCGLWYLVGHLYGQRHVRENEVAPVQCMLRATESLLKSITTVRDVERTTMMIQYGRLVEAEQKLSHLEQVAEKN